MEDWTIRFAIGICAVGVVLLVIELQALRKQLVFAAKQREEMKHLLGNIDARLSLAQMQDSRVSEQRRASASA